MLILASASPRRHALMQQVALAHRIQPAFIDETRLSGEKAQEYVLRLATEKARAVAAHAPDDIVLAADTTVTLDGDILNKPTDAKAAAAMLYRLSGRTHHVYTGIALARSGRELSHVEQTAVSFSPIPEDELRTYIDSGDPLDKAGAYGIQGYPARWVTRIEGDFYNVVGLPLAATVQLLRRISLA